MEDGTSGTGEFNSLSGPLLGDLERGVHQLADCRGVFRRTDGIVTHHAFETLHGPRSMEGENFIEKGFAVGKGACLVHKPAARSMKGPFFGTGIEAVVFLLKTGHFHSLAEGSKEGRVSAAPRGVGNVVADVAMARIEAASRGETPILSAWISVVYEGEGYDLWS